MSSVVRAFAKKILHIDPEDRYSHQPKDLDERARDYILDPYLEDEPTVREWAKNLVPNRQDTAQYFHNLFPFTGWMRRYNLHWLLGDGIAGLTIGLVVVPQALAYATLAELTPEYGLYTSFTGAVLYWLFGTSKDIVIGTTAVGSLLVGHIIHDVHADPAFEDHAKADIARTLSLMSGSILFLFGLLRLGWIIEFIPYVPISAFVTAASITIMSTQFPVALGLDINTRESAYQVIINTLKALPETKLDAAIGLTCIAMLFAIRKLCATMEVRQPSKKRVWAMISSLRLSFAMLFYTMISWLVHRGSSEAQDRKFAIVGDIPKGLKEAGVPSLDGGVMLRILPGIAPVVIILVIEHIAIAKSFGRIFNYTIIPSQEVLAQGAANILSPFVGGYVCTGSFGASAVLSKAGVRTPLAGVFSAMVLILSLYALTSVFFYIPKAALAGLIIHATANLVASPRSLYKYWLLSPLELFIWIVGVVVALFDTLETSIYVTIALSLVLLLVRNSRSKGRFLGRIRVSRVETKSGGTKTPESEDTRTSGEASKTLTARDVFLPIDRGDGSNPSVEVSSCYPGVILYRFSEGFNYLNQAQHMDQLLRHVYQNTRPTKADDGIKPADRLWNDPGPRGEGDEKAKSLPLLKAIVLDCTAVNNMDITSLQGLIDLRNRLDRYAAPGVVEWHFAGLVNRWTRRSLAVSGFGYPSADNPDALGNWQPAYTVATSLAGATQDEDYVAKRQAEIVDKKDEEKVKKRTRRTSMDPEAEDSHEASGTAGEASETMEAGEAGASRGRVAAVHSVNRPFFHLDLVEAVDAAVRDASRQGGEAALATNEKS